VLIRFVCALETQDEEVSFAIRRKVENDLFWRDFDPRVIKPREPDIVWVRTGAGLDLELGVDRVACTAA
jgi:hypothetical protein